MVISSSLLNLPQVIVDVIKAENLPATQETLMFYALKLIGVIVAFLGFFCVSCESIFISTLTKRKLECHHQQECVTLSSRLGCSSKGYSFYMAKYNVRFQRKKPNINNVPYPES